HVKRERLSCFQIDHQLVLGRRLHRQVGRLLALEDAIDIAGRTPALVDEIRSVGNQAARVGKATFVVDCRQLVPGCERDDQVAMKRRDGLPVTISPLFGPLANAAMPCSIPLGSCRSSGRNSTPNDGATAWSAPNWPGPAAIAESRRTATRVR